MANFSTAISRPARRGAVLFISGAVALLTAARPWASAPAAHDAAPVGTWVQPGQPVVLRLAPPTGRPAAAQTAAAAPADTSATGMGAVWADVRRRSYFLAADAATPVVRHADNAAQHLTAQLAPARYMLVAALPSVPAPTTAGPLAAVTATPGKPAWQLRLTLRGIGRAGRLAFGPAATPTLAAATDTSVRYQHGAAFATEYTNTPAGLRQNYYLARRPAGSTGPVTVALALETTLHPTVTPDGQAVDFAPATGGGAVLRYGRLKAWDATGRVLPSRLRLHGATALALEVDDAGAAYPLTIDPLVSTAPDTRAGEAASSFFGHSVAGAGDVNGDGYADVVVGAYGYANFTGRAYVYYGSATGLSATAPDIRTGEAANQYFGRSASGAGDINGDSYADIVVGADVINNFTGKAYVYYGSATGLSAAAPDTRVGEAANNSFGRIVAGAGDVNGDGYADVLVGASGNASFRGKAYVYYGAATGLSPAAPDTRTGEATSNSFAISLAGASDVNGDGYADVVIGASGVTSNTGRVYVYYGAATGLSPAAPATRTGEATNNNFGLSVGGAGDVNGDGYADIVVGAQGVTSNTGRAYVYYGAAAGLSTAAPATRTGEATGDYFGTRVAGAGDVNGDGYADLVVGAFLKASGTGKAYVYYGAAVGLSTVAPDTRTGEAANDSFGGSVAGVGDVNGDGYADVAVGAPGNASGTGKAYLYYGSPGPLSTTAAIQLDGAAAGDLFGCKTAGAGDVNGDGYADIIVGAYGSNTKAGKAYVYLGSATGISATAATQFNGAANEFFGISVAGAGDVNGDGYADVIIGANGSTNNAGKAYVYLGSATGLSTIPATTLAVAVPVNFFGSSVAGAGDVNGDGYADVIVGAYGTSYTGNAYVYLGSATGLVNMPATTLAGEATFNLFGISLAGAGDVNGDGYADVIIGAYGNTDYTGKAYIYLGAATGLVSTPATVLVGEAMYGNFGYSVAGAGDVNGDGYADAIVGADYVNDNAGRAYVYLGSAAGLNATPANTFSGAFPSSYFGASVAGAGDVNGDGYADVVIGAYGNTVRLGRVYTYLGSAAGLSTPLAPTLASQVVSNSFGFSVAGAGDVDGDGYADVLVGAYTADPSGRTDAGSMYLYRGNAGLARPAAVRLYNTDLSTPLGAVNKPLGQFGLGLVARSPYGRGRVRLVWETVANGQPFSSSSPITNSTQFTARGPWTDLLPGSATELKSLVSKTGRATKVRARLEYASAALAAGSPAAGTGGVGGQARYGPWQYVSAQQLGQSSSAATPLPVELVAFTASLEETQAVRLAWATASEKNSAAFEVQRSPDGRTFAAIGTVQAAGSSSARRSYTFLDAQLPTGTAALYYRLRQVDTDGSFSYSPVRVVTWAAVLSVYPNPAAGAATLTGAAPGAAVQVFNALGRRVFTTTADATGTARLTLPAGMYLVRAGGRVVRLVRE